MDNIPAQGETNEIPRLADGEESGEEMSQRAEQAKALKGFCCSVLDNYFLGMVTSALISLGALSEAVEASQEGLSKSSVGKFGVNESLPDTLKYPNHVLHIGSPGV